MLSLSLWRCHYNLKYDAKAVLEEEDRFPLWLARMKRYSFVSAFSIVDDPTAHLETSPNQVQST
jgi:hypothetical protein